MLYEPTTNVLIALHNLLEYSSIDMPKVIDHRNSNRVNSTGDLLEYYIKDAFCGKSYNLNKTDEKKKVYKEIFSYLGNSNNPPDFIIKHGPAVEVKKIEGTNPNGLALNSSYPKDYLHKDDPRIKNECRMCEDEYGGWNKKDMIYAVGNVKNNKLYNLWFIYGDCYCASRETYEKIAETIKEGVSHIPDVEFSETKELGRVNKVDPLGITYLRIRGMWGIDHPASVFKELVNDNSNIYLLLTKKSHDKIKEKPDFSSYLKSGQLEIHEVLIDNPNNPAKDLEAILYRAKI